MVLFSRGQGGNCTPLLLIVTDLDKCDTFLEQDKENGLGEKSGKEGETERVRERERERLTPTEEAE